MLASLTICSFVVVTFATPVSAAVKTGAKCTKAGITEVVRDKSYTCVKTGNKLVWNKGVKTQRTPTGNTAYFQF